MTSGLVFVKQAQAADVTGGGSKWQQQAGLQSSRPRDTDSLRVVHVICVLSNPTPPPPVGGTTMQLTTDCADEAMQVASGEQVEGANELHNNVAGDSVRVLL